MTERLLMSTTATVHTEACPTMQHVIDGRAPRSRVTWTRTYESFPSAVPTGPGEYVEHYRVRDEEEHAIDHVNILITRAELAERTTKYTRCAVCSPDVPAFVPPVRTTKKQAGNLTADDVTRSSTLGQIVDIRHTLASTIITFIDGSSVPLPHEQLIEFYPRARRLTGRGVDR
jgi:hypothetical protein